METDRTMAEILFDLRETDEDLTTLKDMMEFSTDRKKIKKYMDKINNLLDERLILIVTPSP